jgi:hypothetical protein
MLIRRPRGPGQVWGAIEPEEEEDRRLEQPREGEAQAAADRGAVGPGARQLAEPTGRVDCRADHRPVFRCDEDAMPTTHTPLLALLQVKKRIVRNKLKGAKNYKGEEAHSLVACCLNTAGVVQSAACQHDSSSRCAGRAKN